MNPNQFASVSDVRKNATRVFRYADEGEDVFLLNHNQPKYVLMSFQRYRDVIEELDDSQDLKAINAARQGTGEREPLEKFKKRFQR